MISKRFKYMKGPLNYGGGGLADAVAFPPPKDRRIYIVEGEKEGEKRR